MGYFDTVYISDLNHRAKAVYMYLKDHADKNGRCWPGIKTIAKDLELSSSTVRRALDDLDKAGLVSKTHRWRENGNYSSNLYKDVFCKG